MDTDSRSKRRDGSTSPHPQNETAVANRQAPPRSDASRLGSLRRVWLKAHRWIGLTVGLLFVLIGLTGSVLVFDHAIDEWLNPELLLTRGSGPERPVQELIAAAEKAFGESGAAAHAHSVTSPRVPNGVWTVWFISGTEPDLKFTAVHVDPFTARVTGQRVWGEDLLSWIYRLHFRLLAGETGATVVGVTGMILMLSIMSGIVLWWPLWKHSWRSAFAIRGGARFQYDLHKTIGVVSALLLMVIAFTGVYMEFPEWVKPVVTIFSAETLPPELRSDSAHAEGSITVDKAMAIAQQRFPKASFDHLHPPESSDGVYEIALLQPGEIQSSFGRTQVFVDRFTGKILDVRNPEDFTAADAFFAWQFPLHNGEAFGLVGRWVVLFAGLTPAVLYVSGFLVWWRKRKSKRRQQARGRVVEMPPRERRQRSLESAPAEPAVEAPIPVGSVREPALAGATKSTSR